MLYVLLLASSAVPMWAAASLAELRSPPLFPFGPVKVKTSMVMCVTRKVLVAVAAGFVCCGHCMPRDFGELLSLQHMPIDNLQTSVQLRHAGEVYRQPARA